MITTKLPNQSSIMTVLTRSVIKASKGLLRDFAELENLQVSVKSNKTFVTSADLHANKVLQAELSRARPAYSIISEESEKVVGEDPSYCWIIDPLDGTVNYMHGLPHWAISVAVEKDGEIVAAVTYDPIANEMFWAEKGCGAYVNDQKIRVSGRRGLNDALVSFGNLPSVKYPKVAATFSTVRRMGSMTLDMAYLAAGRIDVLYATEDSNIWDIAAGALLIKEAGGMLADEKGNSVDNYRGVRIMSNINLMSLAKL